MDTPLTRYEALMLCVERAGSISQLGRDLGIPQATMSRIVNSSKQLPAEQGQVLTAERLYGVSRHDLRPDVYPRETMTDRHIGQRFQGVDACAGRFPLHGAKDSRALAGVDFNRPAQMKAAP